jgi:hypothetical protein
MSCHADFNLPGCRIAKMMNCMGRRNAQSHFDEGVLQECQTKITDFVYAFDSLLANYMGSKGNTIKMHKALKHFTDAVRRLGAPKHQSSNPFEANFKVTKGMIR